MADKLVTILKEKGYHFFLDSPSNQQFIIINKQQYELLSKEVHTSFWEEIDSEHIVIRFATSWSTTEGELNQLAEILPIHQA